MNADGDDRPSRRLSINGKKCPITRNLFEGLLRLRADAWPSSRRLWVDAVCINQSDTEERSQQISITARIYKCATRTVVWLGEGDSAQDDINVLATVNCHEQALDTSHGPRIHVWKSSDGAIYDICSLRLHERGSYRQITGERPEVKSKDSVPIFKGVATVFTRRYFHRRWVFQELWNSDRSATRVYWGMCSCPLIKLSGITYAIMNLPQMDRKCRGTSALSVDEAITLAELLLVSDMLDPIFSLDNRPSWNLFDAFYSSYPMECRDARDRVYSPLSVGDNFGIMPDYNLSLTEVCVQFARGLIKNGYLAVVLESSVIHKRRPRDLDCDLTVPSWVPDVREYFRYGVRKREPELQDIIMQISDENTLTLLPYLCGLVKSVEHIEEQYAIKISWLTRVCTSQFEIPVEQASSTSEAPLIALPVWTRASDHVKGTSQWETQDTMIIVAKNLNTGRIQPGDLCCSLASDVSNFGNCVFILRACQLEKEEFELLDTLDIGNERMRAQVLSTVSEYPSAVARTSINIV